MRGWVNILPFQKLRVIFTSTCIRTMRYVSAISWRYAKVNNPCLSGFLATKSFPILVQTCGNLSVLRPVVLRTGLAVGVLFPVGLRGALRATR